MRLFLFSGLDSVGSPHIFHCFQMVCHRGLSSGSEFQKLSLDHPLTLAGGHIWDQSPAALPRQSATTKHNQGTLEKTNQDFKTLSWIAILLRPTGPMAT